MKLITPIFLLCIASICNAQGLADLSTHLIVKDSIVSKYNRGDFSGVYDLSDTAFRRFITRDNFIEFLKRVNQSGFVVSSRLTEDLGDVKYFRLTMEKISLDLTLSVTRGRQFSLFAINPARPFDTTYVNNIRTDNPLKTPLDSGIDRSVRKYFRSAIAVGCSIGIIKDGKALTYNYGEVKRGEHVLPTGDTYFEIGSITKTFTATVLAYAVTEGKIKLGDDIRNYLPDSFPNLQFDDHAIEIVHLANHTSRIPGLPDDFFTQMPYDSLNPYVNYSDEMYWSALHRVSVDTLPGIKREYSNYGVSILGHILERVYKEDYESLLQRLLLNPLAMKNTKFKMREDDVKQMAQGYTNKAMATPPWDLGPFFPAGALKSTVNDMIKYLRYNIEEKDQSLRLAHRLTWGTNASGTALAWFVSKTPGGLTIYQHDGGTGGFVSYMGFIPDRKVGFIIFSNSNLDLGNLSREITYRLTKK